jgi:serine/threonine protein kinase
MNNRTTLFPNPEEVSSNRPAQNKELQGSLAAVAVFNAEQSPKNPQLLTQVAPQTRFRLSVKLNIFDQNPWTRYNRFMKVDQAGPALLVYAKNRPEKIFAVKEITGVSKDSLNRLQSTIHTNIVRFVTAYYFNGSCFLFYDEMSCNLLQLLSSPRGCLTVGEVALVCRGILEGLTHLHNHLQLSHGQVSVQNVLLSKSGEIKLGTPSGLISIQSCLLICPSKCWKLDAELSKAEHTARPSMCRRNSYCHVAIKLPAPIYDRFH